MKTSVQRILEFWKSEDGPTATEYAVMLGLVILAALGAVTLLGTRVAGVFTIAANSLPDLVN